MRCLRWSAAAVATACLSSASPVFAQTATPDPNSLKSVFTTTIHDFRRLPSSESIAWLTAAGAFAAVGHAKDGDVTARFSSAQRMTPLFSIGETVGGARVQAGAALTTYVVGRITKNARVASLGNDLLRAQIVTQSLTAGIKLSARRHRPDGGEYSFPSGHSSVTFATATVLQRHFGWKVGAPAYGLASYVAASRVHVKRHYLSDVAFGAVLGIVAGRTATIGVAGARFAVAPSATPRGAGVSFTMLDKR